MWISSVSHLFFPRRRCVDKMGNAKSRSKVTPSSAPAGRRDSLVGNSLRPVAAALFALERAAASTGLVVPDVSVATLAMLCAAVDARGLEPGAPPPRAAELSAVGALLPCPISVLHIPTPSRFAFPPPSQVQQPVSMERAFQLLFDASTALARTPCFGSFLVEVDVECGNDGTTMPATATPFQPLLGFLTSPSSCGVVPPGAVMQPAPAKLRTLRIPGADDASDGGVAMAIRASRRTLETLDLSGCSAVGHTSSAMLSCFNPPALRHLNLRGTRMVREAILSDVLVGKASQGRGLAPQLLTLHVGPLSQAAAAHVRAGLEACGGPPNANVIVEEEIVEMREVCM